MGFIVTVVNRVASGLMLIALLPTAALDAQGLHFIGPDGATSTWGYRNGASYLNGSDLVVVDQPYRLKLKNAPVAVLHGPRTGSSGEALVVAFRGRKGTRSFGRETAGASTSNRIFRLADGLRIALTVAVFADRNGVRYGGSIAPDVPLDAPSIVDPADDSDVQAAWHWLIQQPPSHSAGARPFPSSL